MTRKIVITDDAVFIGSNLAKSLAKENEEMIITKTFSGTDAQPPAQEA